MTRTEVIVIVLVAIVLLALALPWLVATREDARLVNCQEQSAVHRSRSQRVCRR